MTGTSGFSRRALLGATLAAAVKRGDARRSDARRSDEAVAWDR